MNSYQLSYFGVSISLNFYAKVDHLKNIVSWIWDPFLLFNVFHVEIEVFEPQKETIYVY